MDRERTVSSSRPLCAVLQWCINKWQIRFSRYTQHLCSPHMPHYEQWEKQQNETSRKKTTVFISIAKYHAVILCSTLLIFFFSTFTITIFPFIWDVAYRTFRLFSVKFLLFFRLQKCVCFITLHTNADKFILFSFFLIKWANE